MNLLKCHSAGDFRGVSLDVFVAALPVSQCDRETSLGTVPIELNGAVLLAHLRLLFFAVSASVT